jgi:protein-tyrosine phosphatase
MGGYIDLHCHWVADIDDGARTVDESQAMLAGLHELGFAKVMATPHMRTGMFDNQKGDIVAAYERTVAELLGREAHVPELGLASEHHLDDLVFKQLVAGDGLPYPDGRAALIEFPNERFPLGHADRLFELRVKRIRPVLAHPERYRPVWEDLAVLDGLLDGGTVLLLDVAALVGKYGRAAKRCAHQLLEAGYYYAACSDAHRPGDLRDVEKGIARLEKVMGRDEAQFMLREGPERILAGTVED